jgi:hypothetical protein
MSDSLGVINFQVTNAIGQPLADVSVAILKGDINGSNPANTTTQPGTPLANIYADPAAQIPLTNPTTPGTNTVTTDGLGNLCSVVNGVTSQGVWVVFSGYGSSQFYVAQIYGPGILGTANTPNQILRPLSFPSGGGGT